MKKLIELAEEKDLCLFKTIEKSNGTTFQDVRKYVERDGGDHELYKCIYCNGKRTDFEKVKFCYKGLKKDEC